MSRATKKDKQAKKKSGSSAAAKKSGAGAGASAGGKGKPRPLHPDEIPDGMEMEDAQMMQEVFLELGIPSEMPLFEAFDYIDMQSLESVLNSGDTTAIKKLMAKEKELVKERLKNYDPTKQRNEDDDDEGEVDEYDEDGERKSGKQQGMRRLAPDGTIMSRFKPGDNVTVKDLEFDDLEHFLLNEYGHTAEGRKHIRKIAGIADLTPGEVADDLKNASDKEKNELLALIQDLESAKEVVARSIRESQTFPDVSKIKAIMIEEDDDEDYDEAAARAINLAHIRVEGEEDTSIERIRELRARVQARLANFEYDISKADRKTQEDYDLLSRLVDLRSAQRQNPEEEAWREFLRALPDNYYREIAKRAPGMPVNPLELLDEFGQTEELLEELERMEEHRLEIQARRQLRAAEKEGKNLVQVMEHEEKKMTAEDEVRAALHKEADRVRSRLRESDEKLRSLAALVTAGADQRRKDILEGGGDPDKGPEDDDDENILRGDNTNALRTVLDETLYDEAMSRGQASILAEAIQKPSKYLVRSKMQVSDVERARKTTAAAALANSVAAWKKRMLEDLAKKQKPTEILTAAINTGATTPTNSDVTMASSSSSSSSSSASVDSEAAAAGIVAPPAPTNIRLKNKDLKRILVAAAKGYHCLPASDEKDAALRAAENESDRILNNLRTERRMKGKAGVAAVDPADAAANAGENVEQRYVYGRVVGSFGPRVLVEQVSNKAYARHHLFFAQDPVSRMFSLAAARVDAVMKEDKKDDDYDDDATVISNSADDSNTGSSLSSPSSSSSKRKGSADDADADAAAAAALEDGLDIRTGQLRGPVPSATGTSSRFWQCIKSRQMDLLCGDYVFVDPYAGRAWSQSQTPSVAATSVLNPSTTTTTTTSSSPFSSVSSASLDKSSSVSASGLGRGGVMGPMDLIAASTMAPTGTSIPRSSCQRRCTHQ